MKQYITLTNAQPYAPHEIDTITDERIKATINMLAERCYTERYDALKASDAKYIDNLTDVRIQVESALDELHDDEPGTAIDILTGLLGTIYQGVE